MSSPVLEDDVFEKLREKVDPQVQEKREREVQARVQAQYDRAQQRLGELVGTNSTLPVTISSVRVLHASHTRRGFLERIFNPVLSANRDAPYTLNEALKEVSIAADKLSRFDIFKSPISIFIDRPPPTDPDTSPTDVAVFLSCAEKPRRVLKTGTEAGSSEGSAYATAHLRNLFGGAESLTLHGSLGTRTRSAYSAAFETPVRSHPDLRVEVSGLASAALKPWASHEEAQWGAAARLKWAARDARWRQELACSALWRQVTGLAENASPTVRADAGDSAKIAVAHAAAWDRRDDPLLPTRGTFLRTSQEIAGFGPLGGDVAFARVEVESQAAVPLISRAPPTPVNTTTSISSSESTSDYPTPPPPAPLPAAASLVASFRTGLLYPLSLAGQTGLTASRISDRFTLGGPTDVRGFRLAGIGPRDSGDAVGGDAYAAGGLSLLLPFPRVDPATPLRLQAFVNGGRLVALSDAPSEGEKGREAAGGGEGGARRVADRVRGAFREMADGYPSCAAGVGVVYAHPAARFEVNFSLPLVLREGEEGRKGLQFGVGMSFM